MTAAILLVLAASQAEAKETRLDGLDVWRKTGDWEEVGTALVQRFDFTKLTSNSGKGVIYNGKKGKSIDLLSKEEFGDVDVHVEFMVPKGSNSGVYLMGRYEIQIFDSWGKDKLEHSDC